MHRLAFTQAHSYAGRDASITVPVVLRAGDQVTEAARWIASALD